MNLASFHAPDAHDAVRTAAGQSFRAVAGVAHACRSLSTSSTRGRSTINSLDTNHQSINHCMHGCYLARPIAAELTAGMQRLCLHRPSAIDSSTNHSQPAAKPTSPVSMLQTRTVLSALPDTILPRSVNAATVLMVSVWPSSAFSTCTISHRQQYTANQYSKAQHGGMDL